jgi:hypothetical protein
MRKLLCLVTAMLFLAPLAFAQQHGTISGTVLAEVNNDTVPVPFGHIMAYPVNGEHPQAMAWTDSSGHYTLTVPFGQYQVKAEAMHFVPEWYDNVEHRSDAAVVPVTPESSPTGIDFLLSGELPPPPPPDQGTISGTVLGTQDSVNVPLRFAHVMAYPINGDHPSGAAMTDSLGQYTLHVAYGDYQIRAEAMHFVPLWYNNVPERSQATTVTVAEGNNPTGIDFLLSHEAPPPPPPGQGTISGTVLGTQDSVHVPLRFAHVFAYPLNGNWPMGMAWTDSQGQYTLHVIFGDYQIRAEAMHFVPLWYNNVPERSQATTVTVSDGNNPTGIDFLLSHQAPPPPPPPPTTGISGTVTDAATNLPIAGAMVSAIDVNNHWLHFMARTLENGTYIMATRPGEYVVQAIARGYVAQDYPTHVAVTEGTIVPGIDFALAAINYGSIAGMVTDSLGAPVIYARVEARSLSGRFAQCARTDSTGAYLIGNVAPGTYRVRAHARGFFPGIYPDSVVVADGQNVTGIDIVLRSALPPFDGMISGNVIDDSTDAPIDNAVVIALAMDPMHRPHSRMCRFAFTDSTGAFSFQNLPVIEFKLFAAARGYIGEFYDNVVRYDEATPVTPNADGINFALAPRPAGMRFLAGMISLPGEDQLGGGIAYAAQSGEIVDVVGIDFDGAYVFDDLEPGAYDISAISLDSQGQTDQPVELTFNDVSDADIVLSPTSVDDNTTVLPTVSSLSQNYPNPFNAQTMISFDLAKPGRVELAVYNIVGQKIVTLIDGEYAAGGHSIIWNGFDSRGTAVSSGIYYYRLKTDDKSETMKMTLLK